MKDKNMKIIVLKLPLIVVKKFLTLYKYGCFVGDIKYYNENYL